MATTRKVRSMSFDEAQDWQFAQRTQPEAEQVAWFATFAAFKEGKVTRTKAQRAFRRAFPEDCTENFDGICRCSKVSTNTGCKPGCAGPNPCSETCDI